MTTLAYARNVCLKAAAIVWDLRAAHTNIERTDREQGRDDVGLDHRARDYGAHKGYT